MWLGFSSSIVYAQSPISAVRLPNQSWQAALSQKVNLSEENVLTSNKNQAFTESADNMGGVPEWTHGLAELNAFSEAAHKVRRYNNPNNQNYQRRAPWLYPLDGCFAKAAHISAFAKAQGRVAPGKVFAFGNLSILTKLSKTGNVHWSYHVVSAYHIASEIYVLDPVVSEMDHVPHTGVMKLADWLAKIAKKPNEIRISLCDANAYDPSSKCIGDRDFGAYLGHVTYYLKEEFANLKLLGLPPDELLSK